MIIRLPTDTLEKQEKSIDTYVGSEWQKEVASGYLFKNLICPKFIEHQHIGNWAKGRRLFRNNHIHSDFCTKMQEHAKLAHRMRHCLAILSHYLAMVENQWEHSSQWMRSLYGQAAQICVCTAFSVGDSRRFCQAESHHFVYVCMCVCEWERESVHVSFYGLNKLWETSQSLILSRSNCAQSDHCNLVHCVWYTMMYSNLWST